MSSISELSARTVGAFRRAHSTSEAPIIRSLVFPALLAALIAIPAAFSGTGVVKTTVLLNFNAILIGFLTISVLKVTEIYSDDIEDHSAKEAIKDTFYIGIAACISGIISAIILVLMDALQFSIVLSLLEQNLQVIPESLLSSPILTILLPSFVIFLSFFYFCYLSLIFISNFYELGNKNYIWDA